MTSNLTVGREGGEGGEGGGGVWGGDWDHPDLHLPDGWQDEQLFSDLDQRADTESIFFHCWLPKFALRIRRDPYRRYRAALCTVLHSTVFSLLRTINKRDPEFNIVW